jgi:hypothetical protein
MIKKYAVLIIIILALVSGCASKDTFTDGNAIQLSVGDSLITIPADAVAFADAHFNRDAYWLREYKLGCSTTCCLDPFAGPLGRWKDMAWVSRSVFVAPPFSRDIRDSDPTNFYYNIGTFAGQFGFGWEDTFPTGTNLADAQSEYIWNDAQGTFWYDGQSQLMNEFRSKWVIESLQ